jgi:hypothetical protein
MPVAKAPHQKSPTRNDDLVATLAARFRQPPESPDAPLAVINRIPQTRSAHVLVVWDQWQDLPIPARSNVIIDAFTRAFGGEDVVVRVPIGLTSGEAFSQGYLRYQISPMVRKSDHINPKQVRDAMATAGGVLVRVGEAQQLRFPTRAQAEEAYRRLVEKINKPIWALSEELSPTSGSG